jgi:hypothetical protein
MKKITMIMALAFTAAVASAQGFKKGNNILEGTASYTKTTGTDGVYTVSPALAHFVTNRVAVGVSGTFGDDGASTTTGFAIFGRCYFLDVKGILVHSQLGFGTIATNTAGDKVTATTANLGLGANYFVTKRLSINAGLGNLMSFTSSDGNSTATIGFTGITNPLNSGSFGLTYRL